MTNQMIINLMKTEKPVYKTSFSNLYSMKYKPRLRRI